MKKIIALAVVLAVAALFLSSCAKEKVVKTDSSGKQTTESMIEAGNNEVGDIESDLNSSDLDNVETDLGDIDW